MGGNLAVRGYEAQPINLKTAKRSKIVPVLNKLLYSIDAAFTRRHGEPLWNADLLKSQQFLSGSSLHFFNTAGVNDDDFVAKKTSVGDMDTMVNRDKEADLREFLTAYEDKKIGPAILRGFQRGNEQFSSLWEITSLNITVQIDFEFVQFNNGTPTDWAKFSHSSSWEDMQNGVKGVFHKWLIQAFTAITRKEFYLRKNVGRGKARSEQDVLTIDNMYSFAVSSKDGGGLRPKYQPIVDASTGKAVVKDGKSVMRATDTTGYQQDIGKIFSSILGKRLSPEAARAIQEKFWSFSGLVSIMKSMLTPEEKAIVLQAFLKKTIGDGAQGIYKNDPDKDIQEKKIAINYLLTNLGVSKPDNLDQLINSYYSSYKMTTDNQQDGENKSKSIVKGMAKKTLGESLPSYRRTGIPHIFNPGSSMEMKDADFIRMCREISQMGGKLDSVPINLKVDGAGIRFGKDKSGRPFFMTSSVNEPKYADNYGDFTNYGKSTGQDEARLSRTKQYDEALRIITNAKFMAAIPNDTIVQAEMLFVPMGQTTNTGIKFVNISYDPSKLGSVMTLIPFSVSQFSNGNPKPDGNNIKQNLVNASNPTIKIVNNQLQQSDIDVSRIISPVVQNEDALLAAISGRGSSEAKTKAKNILSVVRQQLSDAIMNSPNLKGKDQLGSSMEGLVINLPSGRAAKITTPTMKSAVSRKISESTSTRHKPAVVTIGSFVGHRGHQQLIDQTINTAKKLGGDPFIYVSPVVGQDDPIPPKLKIATLQKLYPEYASSFQLWNPTGTPMKKIEKELVLPANSPYNRIILIVGSDRYEGFKNWMNSLEKRMKDPAAHAKFGGTQNTVDFDVINSARESSNGGTGISFTMLRDILKDTSESEKNKLNTWINAFDSKKLGIDWIKNLMTTAAKNMQLQTIKEYITRMKPLLKEASKEQKERLSLLINEAEEKLSGIEHAYYDPETHDILAYARQHYPEEPDLQTAFVKFVLRSLKHSKEDDDRQDREIELLMKQVNSLQDKIKPADHKIDIDESTDYIDEV